MEQEYLYKIASSEELTTLENEVNSLLNQGWVLAGGVACDQGYYVQAVHRRSEPSDQR